MSNLEETFFSAYEHNRLSFPLAKPEDWQFIFRGHQPELEEKFQNRYFLMTPQGTVGVAPKTTEGLEGIYGLARQIEAMDLDWVILHRLDAKKTRVDERKK
jgi:hypothetical protein